MVIKGIRDSCYSHLFCRCWIMFVRVCYIWKVCIIASICVSCTILISVQFRKVKVYIIRCIRTIFIKVNSCICKNLIFCHGLLINGFVFKSCQLFVNFILYGICCICSLYINRIKIKFKSCRDVFICDDDITGYGFACSTDLSFLILVKTCIFFIICKVLCAFVIHVLNCDFKWNMVTNLPFVCIGSLFNIKVCGIDINFCIILCGLRLLIFIKA